MNKAELIKAIAKGAGLTNVEAGKVVEAFVRSVEKALRKGDKVAISGWGTFSVARRNARTGRNPQNGKPIKITAKRQAKFKVGKRLADAMDDKGPPGSKK